MALAHVAVWVDPPRDPSCGMAMEEQNNNSYGSQWQYHGMEWGRWVEGERAEGATRRARWARLAWVMALSSNYCAKWTL